MASSNTASDTGLLKTPLYDLHKTLGARFGAFAGYDMPIQYDHGIISEHLWTRENAGLFDVSHMGPCFLQLTGAAPSADRHDRIAALAEPLVCADIASLAPGEQKLTLLLNEEGGVDDDLMVARLPGPEDDGRLYVVVNAGTKEADFRRLSAALADSGELVRLDDGALLALQGPKAEQILACLAPETAGMDFMTVRRAVIGDIPCIVSRSGYTGEDGFEIYAAASQSVRLAEKLLANPLVRMIGLGARDSLRLEAGLCLYGHELDAGTSPVEAALSWTVARTRRSRADFPGAVRILRELDAGPERKRVGLRLLGRAPAREGTEILSPEGRKLGSVTSGGFSPTLSAPIAMGYVEAGCARYGDPVVLMVRGKPLEAVITRLPFVPHRYKR
jgi:aminomethyltransferase